ncbi:T-cell surface antigen CD2-like isoform X1 [Megalobrama amblycephala]|uniref:T-cell surface antigen CD2-like isoform X1 n=1 Tax=Megalobrama amblycephala TaxID=75352 RepID=UPI00201458EA|nr:T-cell surface antigen CD2-like isoform X1 [Megalobrama amblycephala]
MIFQYNLILMFLCGFAALSVSTETCGKDLLVGTSCIMKLPEKYNNKSNDIKWTHFSSDAVIERRNKKTKSNTPGLTMEEDGSLRFQNVTLKDTGTYTYTVTSSDGTEIGKDKVEIKVYEWVPKPTVNINCTADGNATLSCDVENSKDPSLNVSWYEDGKLIQNEIKPQVFLSSTQVQENKTYSCETHNPVSEDKSENITVSCGNLVHDDDSGFDWIIVSIIAGGGALLLLFLVICAYRSCQRSTKHQQDDEDLTLGHTGTNRSKQTAKGQLAPPIPQEDPMPRRPAPQTPPQTPPQPKAQIRARPPPPPQDEDEEYLTPIPLPRNKQH